MVLTHTLPKSTLDTWGYKKVELQKTDIESISENREKEMGQ